jgi:hypothetical protein
MSSTHQTRIHEIVNAFKAEHEQLIGHLEGLTDEGAEQPPRDGGWSAAQIGWHVGVSNEWLAAALRGDRPIAEPPPADFTENWSAIKIPDKVKTFPQLEPPAAPGRGETVRKLRDSGDRVVEALEGLTPERAAYAIKFPFGTLSLYQVGEFVTAHVRRHIRQIERTLALE